MTRWWRRSTHSTAKWSRLVCEGSPGASVQPTRCGPSPMATCASRTAHTWKPRNWWAASRSSKPQPWMTRWHGHARASRRAACRSKCGRFSSCRPPKRAERFGHERLCAPRPSREIAARRAIFKPRGAGAPIARGDIVTTQSKGPLAGFGWLQRGISVGYRHPKPSFGGAAILLLIALVPALITLPFQFHSLGAGTTQSPAIFISIMAVSMLIGLLLVPLYAGYLQVIDAAERGLPARASAIFSPYRQGDALRLIGYGLVLVVIYLALVGIIILAAGRGIVSWYMQVLTAQANHLQPPGLPQGFGTAMALFTVMGLFMMGFYSVSLGQVALRRRGVFNAIGDGFLGALKNLLP